MDNNNELVAYAMDEVDDGYGTFLHIHLFLFNSV